MVQKQTPENQGETWLLWRVFVKKVACFGALSPLVAKLSKFPDMRKKVACFIEKAKCF